MSQPQPKQRKEQQQHPQKQHEQQGLKGQQPSQQKYKAYRKNRSSPNLFNALLGLLPGFALITSTLATIIRLFSGWSVVKPVAKGRPDKTLKLYEYEGDPNSRLVREAMTMLDLDAVILPCPKGSRRFRAEAVKIGGKEKFPLLVDENNDRKLHGARTIVPYLFRTYGNGEVPFRLRMPFVGLASFFASLVRGFTGVRRKKSAKDTQIDPNSVELYSFESSPHCRLVREVLTELEIPYTLHNVGKGSPHRKEFIKQSGRMMVPYLIDTNTDKGSNGMFESRDIVNYLYKTYTYR